MNLLSFEPIPPERRPKHPLHPIWWGLILAGLGWGLFCCATPFLSDRWPNLVMFNYAPPILLIAPLLFVIICLALGLFTRVARMKKALAILSFVVLSLVITSWELPQRSGGQADLRILTLNIRASNPRAVGLADTLRRERIDLVMMQEVKGGSDSQADSLLAELPGWHVEREQSVAILSRYPLRRHRAIPLVSIPYRHTLIAEVMAPKPFFAATTHWPAPQVSQGVEEGVQGSKNQTRECEVLLTALSSLKKPLILGGDFNCPPRHPLTRRLSQRWNNAFGQTGFGPGWTYPSFAPIIRIDHLYSTQGLVPVSASVGPSFGSDHLSLMADFRWDLPRE